MPLFRSVSLGVVAVLLLALMAVLAVPSVSPARTAAQVDPGCNTPVELVTNGSFEAPGVSDPPGRNTAYTPDGWTGVVDVYTAAILQGGSRTVDGNIYIINLLGGVSQALPTSQYAGQSLALSFVGNPAYLPVVTFGGQAVSYTGSGNGPYTATLTVPAGSGDLTLAFTRGDGELDAVSVTGCPPTPTATATSTATTEPTATTPPTVTVTATAMATATTQPTAGPSMRPTARPRTTATVPATATSSVPTVRPTARPRG